MSISFFRTPGGSVIATEADHRLNAEEIEKLCWLYGGATVETEDGLKGFVRYESAPLSYPSSLSRIESLAVRRITGIWLVPMLS